MLYQCVNEFESFLLSHLPCVKGTNHPYYNQALKSMFEAGGKRFRPMIMLSIVSHYTPLLKTNAYYAASAVEMIHTYSLIHDDLPCMDNSPLRRGKPTLHVQYDEVGALLIGDALNTHAFYLLASAPLDESVKISLIKELSLNAGAYGMVLGQALDCYFEKTKISIETLQELHLNKTAKLIAASLKMGAIIANLSEEKQAFWYDFGIDLGVLFQVQDDLKDISSSEENEGKPIGNDKFKNSFPNALGLDKTIAFKNELLEKLHAKLDLLPPPISENFSQFIKYIF